MFTDKDKVFICLLVDPVYPHCYDFTASIANRKTGLVLVIQLVDSQSSSQSVCSPALGPFGFFWLQNTSYTVSLMCAKYCLLA